MSNTFEDVVEVELSCWCHGLASIEGEVDRQALNEVVKDFSAVLSEAVENEYVFDLNLIVKRLLDAAGCQNLEREITHYILSLLPLPKSLTPAQEVVLKEVVTTSDRYFPGALARLEKKWSATARNSTSLGAKKTKSSITSFDSLSLPSKSPF